MAVWEKDRAQILGRRRRKGKAILFDVFELSLFDARRRSSQSSAVTGARSEEADYSNERNVRTGTISSA